MKRETKHLSSGGTVDIFDDVYTYGEMVKFMLFFQNSLFKLSAKASLLNDHDSIKNWVSRYSNEDVENLGIFNNSNFHSINETIRDRKFVRAWVNCFTPCSIVWYHTDYGKNYNAKTFLYYCNTEWRKDQGGETLLYNDNMNPEIIIEYKPNRVIIYDSHIPHKPLQHIAGNTPYRFTFVATFKYDE